MNAIRYSLTVFIVTAPLFSIPVAAADLSTNSNVVAAVFGRHVSAAEIGLSDSATTNVASKSLLDLIWREVSDQYAQKNNLVATDAECEAYEKFLEESVARNKEKTRQDLTNLERQLKSESLSEAKRNELEQYRKTLLPLEAQEERFKDFPQTIKRQASRQWVTAYKVYKAIYEQYGGKVAVTAFGLYPIEARRKLIEQHISAGDIRFLDAQFETEFWKSYEAGGRLVAKKEQIDFTPYWLKPIPNSPD